MKNHLVFNDGYNEYKNIIFLLERKSKKNLSIRINSKNEIYVSIPLKTSNNLLIKFLDENLEKFAKYLNNKKTKNWFNSEEKWFYLFGKKHFFILDEIKHKILITENNKTLSYNEKKNIEQAIDNFRKKELNTYLIIKQLYFQKIMDITNHKIVVRIKNSSWATNYIKTKTIYYSLNLASFAKEIIDYVIVHELSHHLFPNHSKDFWLCVEKYDPDFKIKRNKLKEMIYY